MLSEMQVNNRQYAPLEKPITMRIRFRKVGNLQYISHLDLQRTLQRVLVRAGVPVWYTKGFNPHMKIVFSTPLSIGAESICEMVDIRIDGDISPAEFMERLNEQVTDELRILDAYISDAKFSDIIWSKYEILLSSLDLSEDLAKQLCQVLTEDELLATKKTKSGEKNINIIPLVRDFSADFDQEKKEIRICTLLRADGENYLNPDLFLSSLRKQCGILSGDEDKYNYSILRVENYFEDGTTVFR